MEKLAKIKVKQNKNLEEKNWEKEQSCQPFYNYKIAKTLEMISFRSLSRIMLQNCYLKCAHLFTDAFYDKR